MRRTAQTKADILIEAFPYIRRWYGQTAVVKVGGEIVEEDDILDTFATDLALMRFVGIRPVVVHGGGPQISKRMRDRGLSPSFVQGYRVTDAETVQVVRSVLDHVNARIVEAINEKGARAVAVAGEDEPLLVVRRALGPDGEDIGFVGEVEQVNTSVLEPLLEDELIPVVAPVGSGVDGVYNINADVAAASIARALKAAKIVFLTNVEGLYRDFGDQGSLISQTTVKQLRTLLAGDTLSKGIIPKVRSVVEAMESGVSRAHILDGRHPHALLLEIFTDEGVGTMVLP